MARPVVANDPQEPPIIPTAIAVPPQNELETWAAPAVQERYKKEAPSARLHNQSLIDKILATRITDQTPVRSLAVAITIAGATFARRGDFSVVMGQRKAGKTTILKYVVATALMAPGPPRPDTMQIKTAYCQGKAVIYVDTEGSQEDTKDFVEGVKKILGVDQMPENFHVYHWRNLTQKECREAMEILFEHHRDSHLWVIDGIADLVSKPNDEQESNETVRWLMNNAGRLDACFVVIIHENPSKQGQEAKARGHLGSELERKASGAIAVEKDKEKKCHFIRSRFLRKSADFEPISFWWEDGHPISRTVTPEEKRLFTDSKYRKAQELTGIRNQCFAGSTTATKEILKNRLAGILPGLDEKSKDTARVNIARTIKEMEKLNLIRESNDADGKTHYVMILNGQADPAPAPF